MLKGIYFEVAAVCGDRTLSRYKIHEMILSTSGAAAGSDGKVALILNPHKLNKGERVLVKKEDALKIKSLENPLVDFELENKSVVEAREDSGCKLYIPCRIMQDGDMPDVVDITEKNQNPKLKEGCKSTKVKIDLLMKVLKAIKEMSSSETVDIYLANNLAKDDYNSSLRIEGETSVGPVVGTIMPLWKYK